MSASGDNIVVFRRPPAELDRRALERFARLLRERVARGVPFTCLVTGDADLRRLNRRFLGHDYSTDVLSFPSLEPASGLGDLAISGPRARAQARACGHSLQNEVRILMLHGLLHLLGMDHERDGGRMRRAESQWRRRLSLPDALIARAERA